MSPNAPAISMLLASMVIGLLGMKAFVTFVLLRRPRETWFSTRQNETLWWIGKTTPVLAALCFLALGLIEKNIGYIVASILVLGFALIAIPIKIWRAYGRDRKRSD